MIGCAHDNKLIPVLADRIVRESDAVNFLMPKMSNYSVSNNIRDAIQLHHIRDRYPKTKLDTIDLKALP